MEPRLATAGVSYHCDSTGACGGLEEGEDVATAWIVAARWPDEAANEIGHYAGGV